MFSKTLLVAGSSAAGQLIILIATPFIARMYGPAEMGLYASFAAIAATILTIACLRYEMTLPVVEQSYVSAMMLSALLASVLVAGLLLLLITLLHVVASGPLGGMGTFLWLLPIVALLSGPALAGNYISIRFGQFRLNAIFKLLQPALFVFIAIGCPDVGLPAAHVIGLASGLIFLYAYRDYFGCHLREALASARQHRHYPLTLMPASLLDAAATALPVIFISRFYTFEATGNYSQIQRLTAGPLLIVSAAVGQVFFFECSKRIRSGASPTSLIKRTLLALGGFGVVWILIVLFAGNSILIRLLGKGWRTDTVFILLVLAPFIVKFVVSPLSTLLIANNDQKKLFAWQVLYFTSIVTVLPVSAQFFKFDRFLFVFAINEGVLYMIYLMLILHSSRRDTATVQREL